MTKKNDRKCFLVSLMTKKLAMENTNNSLVASDKAKKIPE